MWKYIKIGTVMGVLLLLLGCGEEKEKDQLIQALENELTESKGEVTLLESELNRIKEEDLKLVKDEYHQIKQELNRIREENRMPDVDLDKQVKIDLNGDDIIDDFQFIGGSGDRIFTIQINQSILQATADNLDGHFNIVDINNNDSWKEIAIFENGPSSDPATFFYYYDQGQIRYMGKVQGDYQHISYHGDGTLSTNRQRGDILHTWFYREDYRLNDHHMLEVVPRDLYEMGLEVTLLQSLTIDEDKMGRGESFEINQGEHIIIKATDNHTWCLIETQDGKEGWIEVEDYHRIVSVDELAHDVFEGLNYAD